MQVMSHPGVDYTRTVSNHIIDIIDVLGIEAARAALLKVPCFCPWSPRTHDLSCRHLSSFRKHWMGFL